MARHTQPCDSDYERMGPQILRMLKSRSPASLASDSAQTPRSDMTFHRVCLELLTLEMTCLSIDKFRALRKEDPLSDGVLIIYCHRRSHHKPAGVK